MATKKVQVKSETPKKPAEKQCPSCKGSGLKNGVIDATEYCSKCEGSGKV